VDVGAVLRKGAHDKRLHTSELTQLLDGARWGRCRKRQVLRPAPKVFVSGGSCILVLLAARSPALGWRNY
jgi:hypothetical protein